MESSSLKSQLQKELERLPFKKQIIYENSEQLIDSATGEMLDKKVTQKVRTTTEPDFIKIYYKAMLAVQGIESIPLEFILALSNVITYSNNPNNPVYFYNNAMNRQLIAGVCMNKNGKPISDNMVSRHITNAVKIGLLFKVKGMRGVYEVNPCIIAKGRWENIKGLQANFDFVEGKWVRTIIEDATQNQNEDKESA